MSELKCPYCNKPLHCGATLKSDEYLIDLYQCANPECESTEFLVGCKEFWDILGQHRRTRKALEWARHFLKEIRLRYLIEKDNPSRQNKWADTALYMYNCAESFFDDYDKTALEQKEVK